MRILNTSIVISNTTDKSFKKYNFPPFLSFKYVFTNGVCALQVVGGGGESMAEPEDVEPVLDTEEKVEEELPPMVNGISEHNHQVSCLATPDSIRKT